MLKLQQYRQTSLIKRLNEKLSPRYYGPFTVSERIGQVAYRLELPAIVRIHNVFHISQLKKAVGNAQMTPDVPTNITSDLIFVAELESLLQVRTQTYGEQAIIESLIKWKESPV